MKKANHTKQQRSLSRLGAAVTAACLLSLHALPAGAGEGREISDGEISDAIENEFQFDPAVPFNDLDVVTKEGIVTLQGATSNILAKERAGLLAETVRGVRSVINLVEVKPPSGITGKSLAGSIERALLHDPATDSYEVDVAVAEGGAVTLTGDVQSYQEKRLCETVAKGVRGVVSVDNRLDIEVEAPRFDAEIQREIAKRLDWDALLEGDLIEVSVSDGRATLIGVVGSAAEKRRARWSAWVRGIHSVDDTELAVQPWADNPKKRKRSLVARTDDQIREALTDAFLYDPRVFSFNVEPKVEEGVVKLRGMVDNALARDAAESVARRTAGVIGVINRLKVRPKEQLSDDLIEANIRMKFAVDPWIESYEIHANVRDGAATLTGSVDSWFEKTWAETLVNGVKGVKVVHNLLRVESHSGLMPHDPFLWSLNPYPWRYDPATPALIHPMHTDASDARIAKDIEKELFWSPFVDADEVTVVVEDGAVTLTGKVDTISERNAAAENAWEGGALAVNNQLGFKE